jgi:2,3-bisphosphoglycerate-independent phosphoglycerate mutase
VAKARAALKALDAYDLVFVNIKAPDNAGHDRKVAEKVRAIERADEAMGVLREGLGADAVLAVTADHSTPVALGDHSGDPVPLLIHGEGVRVDRVSTFDEVAVAHGGLGRIRGKEIMPILLDLAGRSQKFGA